MEKDSQKKGSFGLPADYKPNQTLETMDVVSGKDYWNPNRTRLAFLYQYYVYVYAAKLAEDRNAKKIMDIGCGPAPKLRLVHNKNPKAHIIGIDQPSAIEYCQSTYNYGTWVVDDFENPRDDMDLPKADLIISSDVIEHLQNPDKLLEYARSKLADGGLILLSTPDRARMTSESQKTPDNPHHIREWTYQELENYVVSRGFEIVEHFHQWPLRLVPSKALIRKIITKIFKGEPRKWKYNQVIVIKPKV
ncbi:MAG: hypothetical protein CL565_05750 [Alphaproteobacteria bacterium]|nr:hypothetical protein [Alphaproteobacteria bacterium]